MKRKVSFVVLMAGCFCALMGLRSAHAQEGFVNRDSTWFFTGNLSVTFNQVMLKNWVAGGLNSISGEAAVLLDLKYKSGKVQWENTLDMAYGLTRQGNEKEDMVMKHLDKFEFTSKFGYEMVDHWYYTALYGLKTQFAPGYQYPDTTHKISDFAAPLYNTFSIGLDYQPDDHFSLLISPVTARNTYISSPYLADLGAFGVKPAEFNAAGVKIKNGERSRWEVGGFLKAAYTNSFFANSLGLTTKLELFSNYLEKPQNIDVNFDILLDYQLTRFLTARAQLTMIYDDDQKVTLDNGKQVAKLQIRQMFGLGLAYRF